jgi:HEAT repeat protein/tetratricopeptide (TPR) repeat protein
MDRHKISGWLLSVTIIVLVLVLSVFISYFNIPAIIKFLIVVIPCSALYILASGNASGSRQNFNHKQGFSTSLAILQKIKNKEKKVTVQRVFELLKLLICKQHSFSKKSISVSTTARTRENLKIDNIGTSHIPESPQRSVVKPASPKLPILDSGRIQRSYVNQVASKAPVRERDSLWYDTSDDRPDLPEELVPSSNSSIEDLINSLEYVNNSKFRCFAAELLGQRGSTATPAISALLVACVDVDETVRRTALNSLELIDPGWPQNPEVKKAFPELTEVFKHSLCFKHSYDDDVSKVAYKLLQKIGKPAISSLANLIVEEEDKIEYQVRAIWLIKDIGPSAASAVPQIIQALSNKASRVRIAAAEALVYFNSVAKADIPITISEFIVGLGDRDIDVRKAMVACLLATKPAVPDLLPLLAAKNSNVCESVADALIQIGPHAVPILLKTVLRWYDNPKEKYQRITVATMQILRSIEIDTSVIMPRVALALLELDLDIKKEDDIKALVDCLSQCIVQQSPQPAFDEDVRDTATVNRDESGKKKLGFTIHEDMLDENVRDTITASSDSSSRCFHKQVVLEVCEILRQQIATSQDKSKIWQIYTKTLSLAKACDCDALTQIISKFDPLVGEQNISDNSLAIEQTVSSLLKQASKNLETLETAWLLAKRLNQPSLRREVQQQICLQLIQVANSNLLVTKLIESSLYPAEISPIIHSSFERYSPLPSSPWKPFLDQFNLDELPQIHQVYAVLEHYDKASQLAEAVGNYRHAAHYHHLMGLSDREIAFRMLDLAERSGDRAVIVEAHQKMAEIFLQEGSYRTALSHFQKAGNHERARYCYEKLGKSVENIPQPFQSSSSKVQQSSSQAEQIELNEHKARLLQLLYGDHEQCRRLFRYERERSPNKTEMELYKDAISRLLRDRRSHLNSGPSKSPVRKSGRIGF